MSLLWGQKQTLPYDQIMELLEIPIVMTGWAILRGLSRGKWLCQSMFNRDHLEVSPAGALFFSKNGKIFVTVTGQAVTGFLFYILVGLAAYVTFVH